MKYSAIELRTIRLSLIVKVKEIGNYAGGRSSGGYKFTVRALQSVSVL